MAEALSLPASGAPLLVTWSHDPAVVRGSSLAYTGAVPEPVALQRANTWKETSKMRSGQYLKHIAKLERAATLRASWMTRKQRFKHIAKEMRTKASLSAGDSRHRFYDGRVKKWSADAETIVSMGFDLPAAIMALQNKSGRTDEAILWLSGQGHTANEAMEDELLQYIAAVERAASPTKDEEAVDPDKDPGNVVGDPLDSLALPPVHTEVNTINGNFTLGSFTCEPLAYREKQAVYTDFHGVNIKAYPNRMRGGMLVKTPNCREARSNGIGMFDPESMERTLAFVTPLPSRVYVCVDHRMAESGQAPTWLAHKGFSLLPNCIVLMADETFDYYVVYCSDTTTGAGDFVVLGPNASGLSLEGQSETAFHHYFVIVVAERDDGGMALTATAAAAAGGGGGAGEQYYGGKSGF